MTQSIHPNPSPVIELATALEESKAKESRRLGQKMIYVDMDGVVADFDSAIVKLFGEEGLDRNADKFWKQTCVESEVFRHMDEIREGIVMVLSLIENGFKVCFMTSTGGMPHHLDIAKQKLDWLKSHHLGSLPIAFCMNTEGKGLFAQSGSVLIDDRQKVVDAWDRNGGKGILFTKEAAPFIWQQVHSIVRGE